MSVQNYDDVGYNERDFKAKGKNEMKASVYNQ